MILTLVVPIYHQAQYLPRRIDALLGLTCHYEQHPESVTRCAFSL